MNRTRSIDTMTRRILGGVEELASISSPGPGVTRIAYSPEDARARNWFRERCDRYGLRYDIDAIGNCYGWTPAAEGARPLLVGSHLDSVRAAGRYDGIVGVVAGLEVAHKIVDRGHDLPVVAVSFACEESTRFGFGTIGSKWLVGDLDLDHDPQLVDLDGLALPAILSASGIEELVPVPARTIAEFSGLLEIHIDQGTVLTSAGTRVALVSNIVGVDRLEFSWVGETSHSGGRWRADRRDALVAATQFVVDANEWWRRVDPDGRRLQLTVGSFTVQPNSPNTVPGSVTAIVDTRSSDLGLMDAATEEISRIARSAAEEGGVELVSHHLGRSDPLETDAELSAILSIAAGSAGVPLPLLPSLAGHDALVIGRHVPAAMLLLANPTGISHAPSEGLDQSGLGDAMKVVIEALPTLVEASSRRPDR